MKQQAKRVAAHVAQLRRSARVDQDWRRAREMRVAIARALTYMARLRKLRAWCDRRGIRFIEVSYVPKPNERYAIRTSLTRDAGRPSSLREWAQVYLAQWWMNFVLWRVMDGTEDVWYIIDVARAILIPPLCDSANSAPSAFLPLPSSEEPQ